VPAARDRLNRSSSRWSLRRVLRQSLLACAPQRLLFDRDARGHAIHLTFDDGPHDIYTPEVLDILARYGVKATFFVVGQRCQAHPEILRRLVAEGHSIGNHTFSHVKARDLPVAEWDEEIRRCDQVVASIAGKSTPLVRPPHGDLRAAGLLRLWRRGRTVVLWSVDPKDYACSSADDLRSWFSANRLRPGDVVLLHDVHPWAPLVLAELIEAVQERGDRFARISCGDQDV
jgi:peptidoglycan/xylan/chitin deacetylase (PgdA/CDA1 family)